jgi:hypothetical protein
MKRSARLLAVVVVALAVLTFASGASATTGSWAAYPGQSTVYKTQVQQPINASPPYSVFGSSTTSSSVIPVKFALLSGLGPFVFESIYSDGPSVYTGTGPCGTGTTAPNLNDCAYLTFMPPAGSITFDDLTNLTANYQFTTGNCHGGSLRWSVRVDVGNDQNTANDGSVFIYYGALPNFTDCTSQDPLGVDTNQSGENMITKTDLRYDTSQVGGMFYDSHAHAQTLVGTDHVIRASLVLDSGWAGDQALTLGPTTVNDNTFTPPPATSLAKTCNLPPAQIRVTKQPETGPPELAPALSIQPADTNGWFRIVDCKYIYNLATSSLLGPGFYKVEAVINGGAVAGAAYFYLT